MFIYRFRPTSNYTALGQNKEGGRKTFNWLFRRKRKKAEPERPEEKDARQKQPFSSASPLAQFDPAAHFQHKEARGDFRMRLENYRSLVDALKTIPSLDVNDPRLPPTVEKHAKSFSEMLHEVEFIPGQVVMQGGRVRVEVHHDLFAYITDGTFEYEIAKLNDDAYLIWNFAHDPMAEVKPLFSDKTCSFRLATDPSYSCGEKAVTVCPNGFCLFHMEKGNVDDLAKKMGGVLWETFKKEYESRMKERVESGNYDFRGFRLIGWLSNCLKEHTFKTTVDFRDAFLQSTEFEKSVFESGARFDRAIFDWTVSFNDTAFKGDVSFAGAKFQHHGSGHFVWFRNTLFEGPVDFSGVDFTPEETRAHVKVEPPVRMETVKFKASVNFNGATGVCYVRVEDPQLRELLDTQGSPAPSKPTDEKVRAWQQQLANVTERIFKEPSLSGLWRQKVDLEITIYQELLQRGEDPAKCHLRLGYARLFSGDTDLAKQHFQKCLELRKGDAEALLGLARCDLYWGRTSKETERLLLAAAQNDPKMVAVCDWPGNDLNLWLGVHYLRAGDPGRAVAYLKAATDLNPKGIMVHEYLGRAYLEAGYCEDAIAELEREIEVAPSRYDPHLYLEAIHAALGNREKASYHRNQATYNNPGNILSSEAVQEIYYQVRSPKRVPIPEI